jgi:hypothetical protein
VLAQVHSSGNTNLSFAQSLPFYCNAHYLKAEVGRLRSYGLDGCGSSPDRGHSGQTGPALGPPMGSGGGQVPAAVHSPPSSAELYTHFPIRLNGVVPDQLSKGTTLLFYFQIL